jgi:putative hemolysin
MAMQITPNPYTLKLAENEAELVAAQRLRYRVFVQELGAKPDPGTMTAGLERDHFDPYFDHLVLLDNRIADPMEAVVGVYRLLRSEIAQKQVGFYGASEFDLSKITRSNRSAVELGRSCVAPAHRGGVALHMLWNGVADYVLDHGIEILFGTASFMGGQPQSLSHALSYLHHSHLAPRDLRVRVHPEQGLAMDILPPDQVDRLQAVRQIPPLIKSYLRLGGFVGEGAFVDRDFNAIDVCLLLDTKRMAAKHRLRYTKRIAG